MELREFRLALGLSLEAVAFAVDERLPTNPGKPDERLSKGTLSKVESGKLVPRGDLMLAISAWAEEQRRNRHLPMSYRVTWDHLLEEPSAQVGSK